MDTGPEFTKGPLILNKNAFPVSLTVDLGLAPFNPYAPRIKPCAVASWCGLPAEKLLRRLLPSGVVQPLHRADAQQFARHKVGGVCLCKRNETLDVFLEQDRGRLPDLEHRDLNIEALPVDYADP